MATFNLDSNNMRQTLIFNFFFFKQSHPAGPDRKEQNTLKRVKLQEMSLQRERYGPVPSLRMAFL